MPLSTGIPIYYNKNQEDVIQQTSLSHLRILYYILPGVSAYRDSIKAYRAFPPCMLSYNSFSSPLQKAGSMDPVFCLLFFSKKEIPSVIPADFSSDRQPFRKIIFLQTSAFFLKPFLPVLPPSQIIRSFSSLHRPSPLRIFRQDRITI